LYSFFISANDKEKMMDFPCEVIKVNGKDAIKKYQELKANADVIPVILGDKEEIESSLESMSYIEASFAQILQKAENMDAQQWFIKRKAQDPEYYDTTAGEWEDFEPANDITVHLDILTGEPKPEVYIALVPVVKSWMIPCFLKTGSWNDCPNPEEHAAIFKYWDEKYGINVVGITTDVIELEVRNPPTSKAQALQLAEEQFIYCPDIVYQGTQTIAALASTLLNGKIWFFWWD
jgi:Domain of unknown function (DUF4253)